jgi:folliculin
LSRGFEKLYSIVVIMIDKMFLLNTSNFLSENIKEIAKQIQDRALTVYEQEQRLVPQRAERLNTGKASNVAPRSLKDLTGEQNIFAFLHTSFSWLLSSSGVYFTENLTLGSPSTPAIRDKEVEEGFASVHTDKEDYLMQHFPLNPNLSINDNTFNLRALKRVATSNFNQILYCSLVGIQIVVRSSAPVYSSFTNYFKDYLPTALHRFIIESPTKYLPPSKAKILVLSPDVSVPVNIFQIEFHNNRSDRAYIKCPVEMPSRLPSLMVKMLNAIDEKAFSNTVLDKFVKALVEEWKNKALCLVNNHDEMAKLKKTLGIQAQDEILINYWRSAL